MPFSAPLVSVVIVVRNGCRDIVGALDSVFQQSYTPLEVIVADGMSNDGTRTAVEGYAREHRDISLRLLDNPARIQAPGWNIGIRAARGEFVLRLDAVHCRLDPDYIQSCLRKLMELRQADPSVAAIGGRRLSLPASADPWPTAIALAQTSRFGVGNANYRLGSTAGFVDTLGVPLYRKDILFEVGLFNESLGRSEDNDLHARLRQKGLKLYFHPEATSLYYARGSLSGIASQMFHNGWWVSATLMRLGRSPFGIRHWAPFAFGASLLLLAMMSVPYAAPRILLAVVLAIYLAGSVLAAIVALPGLRFWRVVVVFWLMHASYGAGTAMGLFAGKQGPKIGKATAPGANLG